MTESGQTIALCMIVKNERHVLARCLASVRPLVDAWVIVDTGSTDGTQELVRETMADLPGKLVERPWKNFGHNRSEAVELARPLADYLVVVDADEELVYPEGFRWPALTHDGYDLLRQAGDIEWHCLQLVSSALPWRYESVLHEYLACDLPHSKGFLAAPAIRVRAEGARSRDPLKYRKDALVLEEALLKEPENQRYVFYLAQSYRDAGEAELAIDRYRRRVAMGGWAEEAWYALYQIGAVQQGCGADWAVTQASYLEAYAARPGRAEPLYHLGMHYQRERQFTVALFFFSQAVRIPYPVDDVLFVEVVMYRYLLPLEYAVACYWLGQHDEAIAATDRLLTNPSLTEEQVAHLHRNRQFSVDALRQRAAQ